MSLSLRSGMPARGVDSSADPSNEPDSRGGAPGLPSADLERLIELIPEPVVLLTPDGSVVAANEDAVQMFGSRRYLESARPAVIEDEKAFGRWLAGRDSRQVLRMRTQGTRENGVPFTVDVSARRITHDGRSLGLCVLHELTDDRLMTEAQLYFDAAFETAPIGMALFNTDGEYIRVNESLCRLLDRSADQLLGRRDQEFTHPEDRQSDVDAAWRILSGEIDTWQCEKRFVRPDNSVVWAIANLTFLRTPDGLPLSWVGQFQDITARKGQEAHLRELADRDPLTGVFNRRRLEAQLSARLSAGKLGALLILDLDGFKEINDAHGHRTGDRVLIGVATALQESLRDDDLVARIGGDEFAILLDGATEKDARNVAALALEVVRSRRFRFDPDTKVSASIGIAGFGPHERHSIASLMAEADRAMYQVKARTRTLAIERRREERRRPTRD